MKQQCSSLSVCLSFYFSPRAIYSSFSSSFRLLLRTTQLLIVRAEADDCITCHVTRNGKLRNSNSLSTFTHQLKNKTKRNNEGSSAQWERIAGEEGGGGWTNWAEPQQTNSLTVHCTALHCECTDSVSAECRCHQIVLLVRQILLIWRLAYRETSHY